MRSRDEEDDLKTILIVDEDHEVTGDLQRSLDPAEYRVLVHHDAEDAARALRQGDRVDVLLVDSDANHAGDRNLLELAKASAHDVASIVMMAAATARRTAEALDGGAAAVLDKPFSHEELLDAIARATRAGFRGNLEGISLVDMLQVFHISRRSVVLAVGGDPPTRIVFESGEIVHAQRGDLEGEPVLHEMLESRNGTIQTLPHTPGGPHTIDRTFHSLLLDVLRQRDETLRSGPVDPVPLDDLATELRDADLFDDDEEPPPIAGAFSAAPPDVPPSAPPSPGRSVVVDGPRLAVVPDLAEEEDPPAPETTPEPDPEPSDPPLPRAAPPSALTALPARPWDPMCAAVNAEIPSALATALVDLELGSLLGMYNRVAFTPDFERFVALYTRNLFRGPEIQHIERTTQARSGMGATNEPFLEEIVLTSRHTHHLTKVINRGRVAVMVVVPRRVEIAATWKSLRNLVRGLESNLP